MKISALLSTIAVLTVLSGEAFAGDAENISACINAVEAHAGKELDEFDVVYEAAFLSYSTATWPGVHCEVKFATVWSLVVAGESLVVEGFSGEAARAEYEKLEAKTDKAVAALNTRKDILRRRLTEAEQRLKEPRPNIPEITARVDEGIYKATGQ